MEEQLISFEVAKLAKEKGFEEDVMGWFENRGDKWIEDYPPHYDFGYSCYNTRGSNTMSRPTQSLLQKWIRETRGVNIQIYNNASGYLFAMAKCEGGTDLGWSEYSGPNPSGVWDTYEEALEFALLVQLGTDLEKFGHWSNYVENAIKIWKDI